MATHERDQLDRALEIIADVKGRFPDLADGLSRVSELCDRGMQFGSLTRWVR